VRRKLVTALLIAVFLVATYPFWVGMWLLYQLGT
jgi:hypothetical protein